MPHLIADRLDIGGARWGLDGAEAVLTLRAVISNGDFEEYWRFHLNASTSGSTPAVAGPVHAWRLTGQLTPNELHPKESKLMTVPQAVEPVRQVAGNAGDLQLEMSSFRLRRPPGQAR